MTNLLSQQCQRDVSLLDDTEIQQYLGQLNDDWNQENNIISRSFKLGNYSETLALVNAIASIADQQDHHPDICFGYNSCTVTYSTHSVNGLSLNDFICAAHIDKAATA